MMLRCIPERASRCDAPVILNDSVMLSESILLSPVTSADARALQSGLEKGKFSMTFFSHAADSFAVMVMTPGPKSPPEDRECENAQNIPAKNTAQQRKGDDAGEDGSETNIADSERQTAARAAETDITGNSSPETGPSDNNTPVTVPAQNGIANAADSFPSTISADFLLKYSNFV